MKKLTTEEFILRAKEVHGQKYGYGTTKYIKSNKRVEICCLEHGIFTQRANDHLMGCGCPQCKFDKIANLKRGTKENFVKRANETHKKRYNYSFVEYKNAITKVKIVCSEHGNFKQTPDKHLSGQGCPTCAAKLRADFGQRIRPKNNGYLTTEQFIRQARECHGDIYDYTKSIYVGCQKKLIITCKEHGDFKITPNGHISSKTGCPVCAKILKSIKLRHSTESFITKAQKRHGSVYDYSLVDYKGMLEKVIICCPTHGKFEQMPKSHLWKTSGCPKCSKYISKGERMISLILTEKHISHEIHKSFNNLRGKSKPLFYDVFAPAYKLLIEYDGEQHFKPVTFGKASIQQAKENFKRTLKYDIIKNEFAIENGFTLLRIPYTIKSKEKITQLIHNLLF